MGGRGKKFDARPLNEELRKALNAHDASANAATAEHFGVADREYVITAGVPRCVYGVRYQKQGHPHDTDPECFDITQAELIDIIANTVSDVMSAPK